MIEASVWVQRPNDDGFMEEARIEVSRSDEHEIGLEVKRGDKSVASVYLSVFEAGKLAGELAEAASNST